MFGGPPSAAENKKDWNKLDPNEILVHNMRSLDSIDDLIEDKMRKEYEAKFKSKVTD